MRYLEVRRHGKRNKPHAHLSQEGVSQARRVGNTMGDFDRVVTSTLARAYDTAIAMGYAVDAELASLLPFDEIVTTEMDLGVSYAEAARAFKLGNHATACGQKMVKLWSELVSAARDGGAVLAISHGDVIELGVVACLPNADHAAWGAVSSYCEGARIAFDGAQFVDVSILRV
jgi:broad specificity phosphatase PhoE